MTLEDMIILQIHENQALNLDYRLCTICSEPSTVHLQTKVALGPTRTWERR